MLEELQRMKNRVTWSWNGVIHVYRTEGSFMQWLIANAVFGVLAFVLPLDWGVRGALLMGGVVILAMECMNTAIERVVDDVSVETRDAARQAKDAGSAAVAVAAVAAGIGWICAIVGVMMG